MAHVELNPIAILIAVVASFGLGMAWFGLFAEPWRKAVGKSKEEAEKAGGPLQFVVAALLALGLALAMSVLVDWAKADDWFEGLIAGAFAWAGFVLVTKAGEVVWNWNEKTRTLLLLESGHRLLEFLVVAMILALNPFPT